MARSPEDSVNETRMSLDSHAESLHALAQKAVDKAFSVAAEAGAFDGVREDTRSLTDIGD